VSLFLASCVVLAIPGLWRALDFDPAPLSFFARASLPLAVLCWLVMGVWLMFFSGLKWKTRWAVLGGVVVLFLGFAASVADFKVDGNLAVYPRFRWQSDPALALAKHLEASKKEDLPPIDATIDLVFDYPRYRGLHGDGNVTADMPATSWADAKPRELWRQPCGKGFAGFAVAGNIAVTIEQRGGEETIVCYDRNSGKERWTFGYTASFEHATGSGPRATPTIDSGAVYSFGATGELVCVDATTGEKRWQVNVLEDSEATCVTWGMTSSPLIHDGKVIVNAGVNPAKNVGRALVAYSVKDGSRVWASGDQQAGYSSPMLTTLAGRQQILLFDGGGLAGFDPKDGSELWRYPWKTFQDMNISQPLVVDANRVLISSETSNGCVLLRIIQAEGKLVPEVVWENRSLSAKWANPIRRGSAIFGLSDGMLVCLDVESGKRRWRGRAYGNGQLLGMGNSLLILSEQGDVVLVSADSDKFREMGRLKVFSDRTWNTPALAGRQLFMRNDVEMVCLELPMKE
jgi:outer membrane protein assembly factor BamB